MSRSSWRVVACLALTPFCLVFFTCSAERRGGGRAARGIGAFVAGWK